MPQTKKESFIFTLIMCSFMVLGMSVYTMIRVHGFTASLFSQVLLGFPLAFVVALALDWLLVGPNAKKIAFRFIYEGDSNLKKALIISSCMVVGMVVFMSLFGTLMSGASWDEFLGVWAVTIGLNAIVAYPLQILLVGPLTRFLFVKYIA